MYTNHDIMKTFHTLILGIALLFAVSCKDEPTDSLDTSAEEVTTIYLIRHAEKERSNPDNIDPELTQRGLGRAMHWAEILADASLDAIYTTDYRRTEMTAEPSAVKYGLSTTYYDPETLNIDAFLADNYGKNVLVVGHSNTTPDLVNKLIGDDRFASMDDSDNGSLFIVQRIGEKATVNRLHFSCNCPE